MQIKAGPVAFRQRTAAVHDTEQEFGRGFMEGSMDGDPHNAPILRITDKDSCSRARAGLLLGKIATPALVTYTEYGTPPYMTYDLLSNMRDQHGPNFGMLHVSLASCVDLSETKSSKGRSIEALGCLPPGLVTCLAPRDLLTGNAGVCGPKNVALDTSAGRRSMSSEDFVKMLYHLQPSLACTVTDEVPSNASRSRHSKGLYKTLTWLDAVLASQEGQVDQARRPLLGPVTGGVYEDLRRRSAKEAAARSRYTLRNGRGLDGYYIAGMGLGETAEQRREVLRAVMEELPEEGPRLVAGLHSPIEIIEAVECGVDLLSCPWPTSLVRTGHALTFPLTPTASQGATEEQESAPTPSEAPGDVSSEAQGGTEKGHVADDEAQGGVDAGAQGKGEGQRRASPGRKRRRQEGSAGAPGVGEEEGEEHTTEVDNEEEEEEGDGGLISLWDDRWSRDARPLVPGCQCPACGGGHSRAYVHHLLLAHEILGEELLQLHNLHHFLCFFTQLRRSIQSGTLERYKRHIMRVCGDA